METQITTSDNCIPSTSDGLLRKFQLNNHYSSWNCSRPCWYVDQHRIPLLHLYGNAGGFLHERNQYFGWHQWIGSGSGSCHRWIHHDLQYHPNFERFSSRKASVVAVFHVSLSCDNSSALEIQQVSKILKYFSYQLLFFLICLPKKTLYVKCLISARSHFNFWNCFYK